MVLYRLIFFFFFLGFSHSQSYKVNPLMHLTHTVKSSHPVNGDTASLVFTSHASLQTTRYKPMSVTFSSHIVICAKKREDDFSFHQQESGLVAWQHLLLFTYKVNKSSL